MRWPNGLWVAEERRIQYKITGPDSSANGKDGDVGVTSGLSSSPVCLLLDINLTNTTRPTCVKYQSC